MGREEKPKIILIIWVIIIIVLKTPETKVEF